MRLSIERLTAESSATGFRPEMLEKVIHLISLLDGMKSHPYLSGRLALKGGTALNLFVFDVPRLSVDIDLNYTGTWDRETMQSERPKVEQAVAAVCGRQGFALHRVPSDHAGGKWRLRYEGASGQAGNLEVDVNFMFRVPLWPVQLRDSRPVGSYSVKGVVLVDEHELAAGKMAALLARHAGRDLFDVHELLARGGYDHDKLRIAFVVYGAMNRKDWRTVSVQDVDFDAKELQNMLLPVLRSDHLAEVGDITSWAASLVQGCRSALDVVLPFGEAESEFLDRLLDHGEIEPTLLSKDADMNERILRHPGLLWKAQNVREFKKA